MLRLLTLALTASSAVAGSPFSSNVVELTPKNWREEVEDSPHAVIVNICRQGWGYCQLLQPEWEKLASKVVKGAVKVAYWDTEQPVSRRRGTPELLGQIQGTPTIRLYKPKKKQSVKGSHREKVVVDYQLERKAKDIKAWAEDQMPNYAERVTFGSKDLDKVLAKADKFGLPVAVFFTSKPRTSPLIKLLSVEFRRRLLLAEVPPTKNNQALQTQYGISGDALPGLVVLSPDGGAVVARYAGSDFSKRKLVDFLKEHALKDAVYAPRQPVGAGDGAAEAGGADGSKADDKKPGHTEF